MRLLAKPHAALLCEACLFFRRMRMLERSASPDFSAKKVARKIA